MIAYRPEIDGLRAIAIAAVVLFHSGSSAFAGGYTGVDIFFVISGYLITSIVAKDIAAGRFSFQDFYERRARRILPAFLVMIGVVTVVCFAILLPGDLVAYGRVLIYSLLFISNFRLAAELPYFAPVSTENPLLHVWSLSVEEQFYFIWPGLLILASLFLEPGRRKHFVFALAIASLAASIVLVRYSPRAAFYHLPARGWELLAGAVLALGYVKPVATQKTAETMSWAGLVFIAVSTFLYGKDTPFPGFAAVLPVAGCFLIIHAASVHRTIVSRLLSLGPMIFLGRISYSLYLWHWPPLAFASYILLEPLTPFQAVPYILFALVMATLSWRYVERPFRRSSLNHPPQFERRRFAFPYRAGAAAFSVSAMLIAMGSYFQESKGSPFRWPPETQASLTGPARSHYLLEHICPSFTRNGSGFYRCTLGSPPDGRAGQFALWGDSHADHYLPALATIFTSGTVLMIRACLPLDGVTWVVNGKEGVPGCSSNNRDAMKTLQDLKPNLIVVAGRWTAAPIHDSAYMRAGDFASPALRDAFKEGTALSIFEQAMREQLISLTATGAKVVIMSEVPEYRHDIERCQAMAGRLGLDVQSCGTVPRQSAESNNAVMLELFRKLAAENRNVSIYDPMSGLCDHRTCYSIKGGDVLYRDAHHLNDKGSISLIPSLKRSLPLELFPLRADLPIVQPE